MSFPSSVGFVYGHWEQRQAPKAPVRAATQRRSFTLAPWPDARNDREERKPRDGRNGRETGTPSEADESANVERVAGIAGRFAGELLRLDLHPAPCPSESRTGTGRTGGAAVSKLLTM